MKHESIQLTKKLWAMAKFTLLAKRDVVAIEDEIEKMIRQWTEHVDPSGRTADELRAKLYALVREGISEDIEAEKKRRH